MENKIFEDQLDATSATMRSVVVTGGIGVSDDGWFGEGGHAVAQYTTSDERLKTNAVPIEATRKQNIQTATVDFGREYMLWDMLLDRELGGDFEAATVFRVTLPPVFSQAFPQASQTPPRFSGHDVHLKWKKC